MAIDNCPVQAALRMDRSKSIGNSEGDDDRGRLHVKVNNKTSEPIPVTVTESDGFPFSKTTVNIPASSTIVVDQNLLTGFSRLDYICNFKDSPITVTKSMKIVVQNDAGTITDIISERMGGSIDIDIENTDDSIDQFLEVTNNESFALTMTFLKSKI